MADIVPSQFTPKATLDGTEKLWAVGEQTVTAQQVADLAGDALDGADGREIELQASATHIQWRYVGDATWLDLVPLADLEGPTGAEGPQGPAGTDGTDGAGVPLGGTTGQVLAKASDTDFDTTWTAPAEGGGGAVDSVNGEVGAVVLDAGDVGADPTGSAATVQGNLDSHESSTANPHAVTAAQAGADPTGTAAAAVAAHEAAGDPHPDYLQAITPGLLLAQAVVPVSVYYSDADGRWEFTDGTAVDFTGRACPIHWHGTTAQIPAQGASDNDFHTGDVAFKRTTTL